MDIIPNHKKIRMFIDNEEVVCSNKITIQKEIKNVDTIILNNCYPKSWETTKKYTGFYIPKDYTIFKMYYDYTDWDLVTENDLELLTENEEVLNVGDAMTLIYAGIVKNISPVNLNPNYPHYCNIQVLDFKTFLSEGDLFNFVIESMTIEEAINYVIEKYSGYNFIVGNLDLGNKLTETINNYNCDEKTLFDVLEYFSQITNSIWKTRYLDNDKIAIDFIDLNNLPKGKNLLYDNNFFKTENIKNLTYSLDSTDYRNKQVVTIDQIRGNILNVETVIGKGSKRIYTKENIGGISHLYMNRYTYTVTTIANKEKGYTADAYYEIGNNYIEFNTDYYLGAVIKIEYYPYIKGRQTALNQNEIDRIADQLGNNGIIARYEKRQDVTKSSELANIGQTYLQAKGKQGFVLTLSTINNDIYDIGNVVLFYFQTVGELTPLSLAGNYVVTSKKIELIQNNADETSYIIYTYELNSNYDFENKVNYFGNQRAKLIGNIEEGEYIDKYEDKYINYNIIFKPPVINGN